MGFFTKRESCVGLEVGPNGSKLISLEKSGAGYQVIDFAIQPKNGGLARDTGRAALAVPAENVTVQTMVLPMMPDSELAAAVEFEVEAQLPAAAGEVTVDFIKTGTLTEDDTKKQLILAVIVKNQVVDKIADLARDSGFIPAVMDIEPLALQRAVTRLDPSLMQAGGIYAIVNIGRDATGISLFEQGTLVLTRTVNLGSQKWEHLMPEADVLVTEVRRSLEYHLAQHRRGQAAGVIVTGEGAQAEGLGEYMRSGLDVPVTVFNPVDYLQLAGPAKAKEDEFREAGQGLTLVVGLALCEVN